MYEFIARIVCSTKRIIVKLLNELQTDNQVFTFCVLTHNLSLSIFFTFPFVWMLFQCDSWLRLRLQIYIEMCQESDMKWWCSYRKQQQRINTKPNQITEKREKEEKSITAKTMQNEYGSFSLRWYCLNILFIWYDLPSSS